MGEQRQTVLGRNAAHLHICATPLSVPSSFFDGAASVMVSMLHAYDILALYSSLHERLLRAEKVQEHAHGFEQQEDDQHTPHRRSAAIRRAVAHDGEERKNERPERHECAVYAHGAKAALERREEEDLKAHGGQAREGECGASVGLAEPCERSQVSLVVALERDLYAPRPPIEIGE